MFENFLTNKESWLNGKGPFSQIIFSSRVRLARNFSQHPFPSRATNVQKKIILGKMQEAYTHVKRLQKAMFVNMEDVNEVDRKFLLERHLVSQEHVTSFKNKGILVSEDERIALMINEEDHLRMQVMTSGFDLKQCWEVLNEIDNELSGFIQFAFLPPVGYLTACPTNVGTALRASCMLHLPALVLTKQINKILELLAKISFTTRGFFGEGTQALGDFFQISNQVSLGLSETEIIDNLSGVVNQVKEQEMDARDTLVKKHKARVEDNVWRSLGALRSCRLMNSKEALSHLSMLSLGLDLGIMEGTHLPDGKEGRQVVNNLFIMIQPAHLQKIEGRLLEEGERDYIRAQILREKLSEA
ncbi:MAG: protein arginine kinase [Candidatus Omnitrophota bacterium]